MISVEAAQVMITSAIAEAKHINICIVVSFVDDAGNLKGFGRMDGASSGSIAISQLKAGTSARLSMSTRFLIERNAALPGHPYGGGAIPGIITLPGGFPLFAADGAHVGGIGISGATPELDEQCARAGVAAASLFAIERA